MAGQPPDISDIIAAVRAGRVGADTAREWMALRQAGARHVRAASGTPGEELSPEEWFRLFGVPPAHEEDLGEPVTSVGGYTHAAAAPGEMSDAEADRLFPPASAEEADRRAAAAAPVRVPPPYPPPRAVSADYGPGPIPDAAVYDPVTGWVADLDEAELIEMRHAEIFGDTTGEEAGG